MTNTITIGPPTAANDSSQGYGVGSVWRDIQADRFYVCTSAAIGAAVWAQQSAATLPLPTGAAGEHVTAASPHAVRISDGASFIDPRVVVLPALTKGTQGVTGVSAQDLKDAGRSSIALAAEAVAGSASEALV